MVRHITKKKVMMTMIMKPEKTTMIMKPKKTTRKILMQAMMTTLVTERKVDTDSHLLTFCSLSALF